MTTIYALQCPIDGLIKYIGQTIHPQSRFKQHMSTKENNDKWEWICKLKKLNLSPTMIFLDEVEEDDDVDFWEIHYINLFRSWDFNLFNKKIIKKGFTGGFAVRLTDEGRDRLEALAKHHRRSMNKIIEFAIEEMGERDLTK